MSTPLALQKPVLVSFIPDHLLFIKSLMKRMLIDPAKIKKRHDPTGILEIVVSTKHTNDMLILKKEYGAHPETIIASKKLEEFPASFHGNSTYLVYQPSS